MIEGIPGGNADKPKLTLGLGAEKRKAAQLAAWVEGVGITVTRIPIDELRAKALEGRRAIEEHASQANKDRFIRRLMLNYIRHNLTEYDDLLTKIVDQVGQAEAYI